MHPSRHCRAWLLALGLAAWTVPARAADWEKYLLDDTTFVLAVHVKQIIQSPLFQQEARKLAERLVKQEPAHKVFQDIGFNPLRDVDRVVVILGQSSFPREIKAEAGSPPSLAGVGPFVLLQGRFDPDKIKARAEQAVKDMPGVFKLHGIGKADVLEVSAPGGFSYFGVVVDRSTLLLAPSRDQIEDALEKAAGDRKTELKDPALAKLIKNWDPGQSVHAAATRDLVAGSDTQFHQAGDKTTITVKFRTLGDQGIEMLTGGAAIGADIRARVTLTAKDADAATKLAGKLQAGLNQMRTDLEREVTRDKNLPPVWLDTAKTVKIAARDKTITLEGRAGANLITTAVRAITEELDRSKAP